MTWAVRGGGRQTGGGVKCREEVRTGNSLLIKHYITVINVLPVEIKPQTRWVQAHRHHGLFHRTHPLLPLHCVALTWIITLSGFPQTPDAPQYPSDCLISHTLSLRYLGLEERPETLLLSEYIFKQRKLCQPKLVMSRSSLCHSTATRAIINL